MSMDDARRGCLERKAAQLGCPGNLQLAEWALTIEARLREQEEITEERTERLEDRLMDTRERMAATQRELREMGRFP